MNNNLKKVIKKSPWSYYAVAALWVLAALIFPLAKWYHFVILAVVSFVLFKILDRVLPDITTYVKIVEKPVSSGDKTVDTLINEGRERMKRIGEERLKLTGRHDSFNSRLDKITLTASKIFGYLEKNPRDLPKVRKFFTYYLPGLEKFVSTYVTMSGQQIEGDNLSATMKNIEDTLLTMDSSFVKLLDSLFDSEALDVSTDITVLESMMAKEGIHESDFNK